MDFAQMLATHWASVGLGTYNPTGVNSTIFLGLKASIPSHTGPADTRVFIQIVDTGGMAPQRTQEKRFAYRQPSVQALTIAMTQAAVRNTCEAMVLSLEALVNIMIDNVWYQSVNPEQEPFDFPLDTAQARPRRGFNISAVKRPS